MGMRGSVGRKTWGSEGKVLWLLVALDVVIQRLNGQPEVCVDADLWTRFAEIIFSPVRRHHQ